MKYRYIALTQENTKKLFSERKDVSEKMKQRYELCSECGKKIYYETDEYEQDACYEIEDREYICDDCIIDYVKVKYFKKLEEE